MNSWTTTLLLALGCVAGPAQEAELELVESTPVETSLGNDDLREAFEVWPEMIAAARERLDLAFFYVSDRPDSRLSAVLAAVEAAAARGVAVRILSDKGFHDNTYAEPLDSLGARDGIAVRLYDMRAMTGGVLHAKYLIVDGRAAFVGSQNLDWRALEHIQELGVRVALPEVVAPLERVFELDWALAAGADPPLFPPAAPAWVDTTFAGSAVRVAAVASPRSLLPQDVAWDLPAMVEMIDGATERVQVQLLSYKTSSRDGSYFAELDTALRAAAARGVQVRLILADWSKRQWTIEGLKSLQVMPNLEVKLVTIPQASSGFVPFARVVHAKYLVADGARAWLGTSNWSGDYFTASRNVGVLVEGAAFGGRLAAYHDDLWASEYAETVDPGKAYEAPRIAE